MYKQFYFQIFIIIFAWFLISTTNGKLVPCSVSLESEVCFLVDDYVATGIEKYLEFFLQICHRRNKFLKLFQLFFFLIFVQNNSFLDLLDSKMSRFDFESKILQMFVTLRALTLKHKWDILKMNNL